LLALVLAIGLVVDDSIIVLENIYRRIEAGEPPLLAAFRGAREGGFAVLATTAVLISVFVPLAFLDGNIGQLFTVFALAIAAAVAFSSLTALTLSPLLGCNHGTCLTAFALAIAAAVSFSSLTALTLSTMLGSTILERKERTNKLGKLIERAFSYIEQGYVRVLKRTLAYPWHAALLVIT